MAGTYLQNMKLNERQIIKKPQQNGDYANNKERVETAACVQPPPKERLAIRKEQG